MRVALKIAYLGSEFYGHQRQPDVRTVEGECLRALTAATIIRDPASAFFRSASRTDRGASAVGNAIAFHSALDADAVVGAFNDRARGVWAWAVADVPDDFHPRRAIDRWYRYHVYEDVPLDRLREAARLFVGAHDFRRFTSDPPAAPLRIDSVNANADGDAIAIDFGARSFRRGMVRRIVAALIAVARGDASLDDVRGALDGDRAGFGMMPAEPLFLMDVRYDIPFRTVLKPKVADEWRGLRRRADLELRLLRAVRDAALRPKPAERGAITMEKP